METLNKILETMLMSGVTAIVSAFIGGGVLHLFKTGRQNKKDLNCAFTKIRVLQARVNKLDPEFEEE